MAKTNQTYYNKQGTDFTGMFDAGQQFTPVDWTSITSGLVDKLATETTRRETKKSDIQTKTDELITDLRDYQAGGNQTFNGYVLDGTTMTKDYMLMQNKLMQQGKLDPNSYGRNTQLLQDDWNAFQTAAKTFNEDYAAAVELEKSGDLDALGRLSFGNMQKATDIQTSRIVISTDGRMYSQTEEGKLIGFSNLSGRQQDLNKKFNVQSEVKAGFTDNIAKYQQLTQDRTIESAIERPEFKDAMDTYIEGIIGTIDSPSGTGRNFLSILTEHHGYSLTEDPGKAGGKVILVKADSNGLMQPDLKSLYTEENKTLAEKTLKDSIYNQLDYIETQGGSVSVSERLHNLKKQETLESADDVYALVAGMSSSIANDAQTSLDRLLQKYTGISKVKHIVGGPLNTNQGISITIPGQKQPVDIMFETPEGDRKTRRQITAELFPLFHAGGLGTKDFADIENRYLTSLGDEDAQAYHTSHYTSPQLKGMEGPRAFHYDFSRKELVPRVEVTKIKIAGVDSSTAAGNHSGKISEILEEEALSAKEKDNQIKALNKSFMQELRAALTFTEHEGEELKTGSLDLEVDASGSVVAVIEGKTYVIVDALTGNVNLNKIQELMDARQVGPETYGSRSGGSFSKFN